MPKQLKPYFDWRGGLNTDAAPDNMLDSELAQCDNASLSERGGISKRMGTVALNETSYGLPVEQLIEWPRNNGEVWLLAVVGQDLCRINADGTKTVITSVASSQIGYTFFQDNIYFVDGQSYRRWDGNTVASMQLEVPPAPSLAVGEGIEAQRAVGTYEGRVTFVTDTGIESAPSPAASVYVEQHDSIVWTLPIGGTNVAKRRLYRKDPGKDAFLLIDEIEDNTTTEFVDNIPEGTTEPALLYDVDVIAKCKFLSRHSQSHRFFAAGNPDNPTALYYSEPNDPAKWQATSVLHPTLGDGPVTGLWVFGDALLAIYKNGMWAWRGIDPESDASWKRVPIPLGGIAFNSLGMTPNSLSFLGVGGIYAMSPVVLGYDVTIQPDEGILRNLTENKVEKIVRSITRPDIACGIYDPDNNRYMLAYTDAPGGVRNTKVLVYEWGLGAFHQWTGLAVNDFLYTLDGRLLGATNGFIIQFNQGYRDYNGSSINFLVKTKPFNLDYPFHRKRITRLYIAFRQPPEATDTDPTISAKVTVDDETQVHIFDHPLSENFVWGQEWGRTWGWTELITSRVRISETGHRVQMEFSNNQVDKSCTIYGCAFEFRPVRAKGRRL